MSTGADTKLIGGLAATLGLLLALFGATPAAAWWSGEWTYRKSLEATPQGARLQLGDPISDYPVLVRLTAQNFTFADASPNGADLRFVAADDKTVLPHYVESFDPQAQTAAVWVRLPAIRGDASTPFFLYYGNDKAAAPTTSQPVFDASEVLAVDFARGQGALADLTRPAAQFQTAVPVAGGFAGQGARLGGGDALVVAPSPKLATANGGSFTAQMWVRLDQPQQGGALYTRYAGGAPGLSLGVLDRTLTLDVAGPVSQAQNNVQLASGPLGSRLLLQAAPLPLGAWTHVSLVQRGGSSDQLQVYVNGQLAGAAVGDVPALDGQTVVGALTAQPGAQGAATGVQAGLVGQVDMVRVANVARPSAYFAATYADQAGRGFLTYGADVENAGHGAGYFGAVVTNVTLEGWVVIGLCAIMLVVAIVVMVRKAGEVSAAEKGNADFERAIEGGADPIEASASGGFDGSPSARVARVAAADLQRRFSRGGNSVLRPSAVEAIRARADAQTSKEIARLNRNMVFLTIAIAGGPFLGLLGTVIGVMITFAAIAVEGNVNVNAIAPGVAAALLATAAGLAVAIPALFGYNWLTVRIREVSLQTRVFLDTLIASLNDRYAAA